MKLSIKELQLLQKGLLQVTCTGDPLYEKINKHLTAKTAKKEIKKAQRKIKHANETLKSCCEINNFNYEIDPLHVLHNEIEAIEELEFHPRGSFITINSNKLKEGEIERIVNFKIKNPDFYLKFI